MNRFFDNRVGKERVVILPGEFYVTKKNEVISTVLGSCIAVCLRDATAGVSGMNHFMLPSRPGHTTSAEKEDGARYGDEAVSLLLSAILSAGADASRLTAKVFGGASSISKCCERRCISRENTYTAERFLREKGIPVVVSDTGGPVGRRIQFDTSDGGVQVELLQEKGFESCTVILASERDDPKTDVCCKVGRRVFRSS